MSEKNLTESAWKAFAKGKSYKDADLLKALAAFARADKIGPDERLAALDKLTSEATDLAKANAKDKDLAGFVAEIGKAAGREKQAALKEVAEAKAKKAKEEQAAKAAAAAEDEDGPAALTTKVQALLRQVRSKDDVQFFAMVAIAGKQAAAMVSRSALSGSARALLQKHLGVSGIKFIPGVVRQEEKKITFILESGAGGPLATKLVLGLFGQTGEKFKLRVRAADSQEAEEDDDAAAAGAEPGAAGNAAAAPAAAGDAAAAPGGAAATATGAAAPTAGGTAAATAPEKGRFEKVTADVKAAVGAGHPNADKAKLLLTKALQAAKSDPAAAAAALAQAEALLAGAGGDAKAKADAARAKVAALQQQLAPLLEAIARPGQALSAEAVDLGAQVQRAATMAEDLAEEDPARALVVLQRLSEGGLLARLQAARAAAPPQAAGGAAAAAGDGAAAQGGKKPASLIAQRQFMLTRWKRIPLDLRAEVDVLRQALIDDAADDDPGGLAAAVTTYLDQLIERLQTRLDEAVSAGDAGRIKGLRSEVESDQVMAHLAENPLGDGNRFRKAVVEAIDEIESRMTA
jgi:hypothetical protein